MKKNTISENFGRYRFEFKHLTVLLIILVAFQIILSIIQKTSLENFLDKTQNWYQRDSAERMANLNTTSLELLVENINISIENSEESKKKIIQSFNIIFSQQLLEPNVKQTCLIILKDNIPYIINDGKIFHDFLNHKTAELSPVNNEFKIAADLFLKHKQELMKEEEIFSLLDEEQTFHILVPFVPHGEFIGVFYMKNKPNFKFITEEILSSYDEVAIIYTSLIVLGLLAMYYISSYTVRERDEAKTLFYEEREEHLKDQIDHNKEAMFTKRIYHTHHKAEKVMGFIKEDLRHLTTENISSSKDKLNKYANFISRVIYDMKWYDPPIHTIRNPIFSTNINEVISFIIDNLFLRISKSTNVFSFKLELDEKLPNVKINEFVVWEILEPLMQNSIDHSKVKNVVITVTTKYDEQTKTSLIEIKDNGIGIKEELLELSEEGIKKIFTESVSTNDEKTNRGYGCYIAHQMATKRCLWIIDAENLKEGGAKFSLLIKN
ncbi:MAG: ATP-binding protein [Melioribacteraceae bacterium]